MKKIFLIGVLLIGLGIYVFKQEIQECFFESDLPDPTYIAFEKQLPLYSYNWSLIGTKGSSNPFVKYKRRNVIVNFWSSKSKSSVEEMKVWAKLYEDYKNDIAFVFVTKDSQTDVNRFLKETGYVFPVFYSGSTPLKTIVLDKAPKTYLITKSGRVVVAYSGAANWNSKKFRNLLDEIINQNK
ncbi:TlpA family protein disulfide reductase [Flavobacterium suncheonense]|uniref:Thioredoxin domain-containing protein n=1 Tax=Flavobacterium suncheonense GH29-5 = DSM 17707 TaxID=1121899 RepID=A0A0A2MDH0_9FLAO|nr:thioredoxin-like domain-containing protein [Flavobacterium suncheonense]KGO89641.1 hypothetical protein Q764_07700 [Flavobacterium suncheonense GH29-5 = DSM 17707]